MLGLRMLFLSLLFQSQILPPSIPFPICSHLPVSLIFLPQVYQSSASAHKPQDPHRSRQSSIIILTLGPFETLVVMNGALNT